MEDEGKTNRVDEAATLVCANIGQSIDQFRLLLVMAGLDQIGPLQNINNNH